MAVAQVANVGSTGVIVSANILNGATWTMTQITSGTSKAFRPYVVGGHLLYVTGRYTTYSDYDTQIKMMAAP